MIVYQVVWGLTGHGPKVLVAEVWVAEILLQVLNLFLLDAVLLFVWVVVMVAEEEPIKKHANASIEPIVGRNRNQNIVICADAYACKHARRKIHMCQEPKPKPKPIPKQ
jgi:hypothetical protein